MHERASRLAYQNNASFSELLDLDNSVTVNKKNLQVLEVKNRIAPELIKDFFEILQNPSYNLGSSCNKFRRENIKTFHYVSQIAKYLGPNSGS